MDNIGENSKKIPDLIKDFLQSRQKELPDIRKNLSKRLIETGDYAKIQVMFLLKE